MNNQHFTRPDAWSGGGFYELAIELGQNSDERLFAALQAVWSFPDLEGVFLRRDVEPHVQKRISPTIAHIGGGFHLFGLARLPNLATVGCATVQVREDTGSDWLCFYIPMGNLVAVYPVGAFPFHEPERDDSDWRMSVDTWLSTVAQYVFERVPFDLALIGHEVSGETSAESVRSAGIPEKRWVGYLWSVGGKLQYYPCNEYASPYTLL